MDLEFILPWLPFAVVILGTAAVVEAVKRACRRLLEGRARVAFDALLPLLPIVVCSMAALAPGVLPDGWGLAAALGLGALGGSMSSTLFEIFRRKARAQAEGLRLPGDP